ncbi:hypothetical protein TPMD03_7 [Thiohalocapsa phage LS06-2018-MD03]|nr:hypothetical protein TPMD03_7 [Thiohalocapsa phage LS06-2018-MD03]
MNKITVAKLKGLHGLSSISESDVSTGVKNKTSLLLGLDKLVELLLTDSYEGDFTLSQYDAKGSWLKDVEFNTKVIETYIKDNFMEEGETLYQFYVRLCLLNGLEVYIKEDKRVVKKAIIDNKPNITKFANNHVVVTTKKGRYFQSYSSVVCFKPFSGDKFYLGNRWDYSKTTVKYLGQFLGMCKFEIEDALKSGKAIYLNDLN